MEVEEEFEVPRHQRRVSVIDFFKVMSNNLGIFFCSNTSPSSFCIIVCFCRGFLYSHINAVPKGFSSSIQSIGSVYIVTQVIYPGAFSTADSSFESITRFSSILDTFAGDTFLFDAD